ncbi:MAG TPA: 23S rRNA (adenine(2030)-N(6))-methyltransferase RlmJ, partial [Rhizomicrobium sp.]
MNYRHVFHAGNFADVIKHLALVAVILHLKRKEKPFCVIDTHAGAGCYDLEGTDAARTGEAADGIGRLKSLHSGLDVPEALRVYLDCVKREGEGRYPGSARVAAGLLRPQDRLIAIEKQPNVAKELHNSLKQFANVRVVEADGYERLFALLPPHERRGVVLIDPPFEAENEFTQVADIVSRAYRRFATGIYLVWYPIKSRAEAGALYGEMGTRGISRILRVEIDVGRAPDAGKARLSAAGLMIVNPPYGFEDDMRNAAGVLEPL